MKTKCLIIVASWEERFLLGIKKLLNEQEFDRIIMFYYKEYEDRTRENREKSCEMIHKQDAVCDCIPITFGSPSSTWHAVHDEVKAMNSSKCNVVIDFTTMPREILWIALSLLKSYCVPSNYVYHTPIGYHEEWLSRDPGRPRLVYKLSGVASLGRQTCLIVTTGFDPERTRQLMWFYEPRSILLGFQSGQQYNNIDQNIERHRESLREEYREFDVSEFEINAYSDDRGEAALLKKVVLWRKTHNIVMTSLGPKLGAIAQFNVHSYYPEVSLAYAPSNEFNLEYSAGLSDTHEGTCIW